MWEISGHFGAVYQSRYCASDGYISFFFCICNVSTYCFLFVWKANKVEVGEYDVFMNDFHLCTLGNGSVSMSAIPGPLSKYHGKIGGCWKLIVSHSDTRYRAM